MLSLQREGLWRIGSRVIQTEPFVNDNNKQHPNAWRLVSARALVEEEYANYRKLMHALDNWIPLPLSSYLSAVIIEQWPHPTCPPPRYGIGSASAHKIILADFTETGLLPYWLAEKLGTQWRRSK